MPTPYRVVTRCGWAATGALAVCFAVPHAASAQEGCDFAEGTERYVQEPIPGGGTMSYVRRPHFVCDGGVEIWADSAVANSLLGMSHLLGSVRYLDGTRELTADTARYFTDQGRLQAYGGVRIRDSEDGSQIENGSLVFLRQTGFRDEETLTVTTGPDGVRPKATMTPPPPDSAAADEPAPEPYTVVGDRIVIEGPSFTSVGDVEIERDSLFAYADSVEYQQELDALLLDGSARVVTGGNELVGEVITMGSPGSEASEIWSRGRAKLTGEDLQLTAPQILLVSSDGSLERLVAVPMYGDGETLPDSADLARPVATVEDFELTADSLEVIAPEDVVERVFAAGGARSVSTARDSLNVETLPEIARSDWLEGDTIIVTFLPVAGDDTAEPGADEDRYEVESILAVGNARSLYRLVPADSSAVAGTDPPAVHYVVGAQITIEMRDGEVDGMEVVGQTHGVHLEPLARRAAPDSVADTTGARPGSVVMRPPTPSGSLHEAPNGARRSQHQSSTPREEEPWRRK